ncbi:hypothetical protein C6P97_04920 [Burkholderia multivorans]|nr:hypothetical protein C6P97_04920 [Burkholderia multivorans]
MEQRPVAVAQRYSDLIEQGRQLYSFELIVAQSRLFPLRDPFQEFNESDAIRRRAVILMT